MWRVTTRFSGTLVTGGGINRLYFSDPTFTAAQAENATFVFWNSLRPQMSDGVTFTTDAIVDQVDHDDGKILSQVATTSHSFSGTNGSAAQPKATQGIIQARTGQFLNGREVRGRVFVPGVVSTQVAGGSPTAAYITALTAAGNALRDDPVSSWVMWHRPIVDEDGNVVVPGSEWLVTACGSPTKFGVLRSRRD